LQVKLCDPRLSALSVVATIKALYKYTSFLSFSFSLDCKAVTTRRIADTYKPKPNPYLNTNPNPTSILYKDSSIDFTLCTV